MLDIAPRPVAPAPSKVDHSIQEGRLNLSVTSDHPSSVELPPSQAKVETSPEAVSEQSAKKGVSTGPTPPPLLILDLNGCILYRQYVPGAAKIIKPRPHLDDLFEYISALHSKDDQTPNWEIMIWSSAQPRNVELMVEAIKLSRRPPVVRATRRRLAAQKGQLSDISNRLDALALNDSAPASNDDEAVKKPMKRTVMDVWDRDTLDLSSKDYGNKVATTKDLCKVWNQVSWTDPKTGDQLKWGAHNTIIVDDSPDKLSLQPDNLFLVDEFKGDPDDTAILKLMETLKSLRDEPNIPEALKKLKAKEAVA